MTRVYLNGVNCDESKGNMWNVWIAGYFTDI